MLELPIVIHDEPPRYQAYMLRCWEVRSPQPNGPVTWRFSIEDPRTGEKQGFADLDGLVEYLRIELEIEEKQ